MFILRCVDITGMQIHVLHVFMLPCFILSLFYRFLASFLHFILFIKKVDKNRSNLRTKEQQTVKKHISRLTEFCSVLKTETQGKCLAVRFELK